MLTRELVLARAQALDAAIARQTEILLRLQGERQDCTFWLDQLGDSPPPPPENPVEVSHGSAQPDRGDPDL